MTEQAAPLHEDGREATGETDAEAPPSVLRRRMTQAEIDLFAAVLGGLGANPMFHLVMRLDDSEEAIARRRATLASLARQVYPHWTLRLVARYRDADFGALVGRLRDGRDDVRRLRERVLHWPEEREALRDRMLSGFAGLSERVALAGPGNGALVPGADAGFVMILRPGDELGCDALAEMAVAAGLDRDADFLYSDEERPNCATGAIEPFCKPRWSPDLLMSTNYVGRVWCAAPQLLARAEITVGDWLRHGEYDLVLRTTENARGIRHVAAVLCRRWGDRIDSEALDERALTRACERRGIEGNVLRGGAPGTYRVKRRVTGGRRVSIIIPTRAAGGLVKRCIESLRRMTAYPDYEIVAIDDIPAADSETKAWLRANADTVVAASGAFNWSRFNNLAAKEATGEFLLFLNDDVEIIEPGWLEALVSHAQRPEIGAAGPLLLYPDGTVQHAGMFLAEPNNARHAFRHNKREAPGYFGMAHAERDVSGLTGACLMTRRDVFNRLHGFDEAHEIINNDLDFCFRVRRLGLLCVFTPHAALVHREGSSRAEGHERYDEAAFTDAWGGAFVRGDPYHNPALARGLNDIVVDPEEVEVVCSGHPVFDRDAIRETLVLKLDHLGDCVGGVPAIRRLKRHFPAASICVLSGLWAKPI